MKLVCIECIFILILKKNWKNEKKKKVINDLKWYYKVKCMSLKYDKAFIKMISKILSKSFNKS